MRLFEAIVDANHRTVAGDHTAGLHPADYADELPVIALTCIDPRLNVLFPNVLGIPADQFIWLRNAGNIITGPLTSTMRSLALACAVKQGREIAIIGHTDCHVCHTTTMMLLDKLKNLGVDRHHLPENINDFFGMFASERQNVSKACDYARHSPLIGPKIPVHGLLVDIGTGKLDWVINGYDTCPALPQHTEIDFGQSAATAIGALGSRGVFELGEMKFPSHKIGELGGHHDWENSPPVPAVAAPTPAGPEPPPIGSTGPPTIQLPPPDMWRRPGTAVPPGSPAKKPLPPPIKPRS